MCTLIPSVRIASRGFSATLCFMSYDSATHTDLTTQNVSVLVVTEESLGASASLLAVIKSVKLL